MIDGFVCIKIFVDLFHDEACSQYPNYVYPPPMFSPTFSTYFRHYPPTIPHTIYRNAQHDLNRTYNATIPSYDHDIYDYTQSSPTIFHQQ